MSYRKLRTAWSMGCAIACVPLIVMWVRSYWWLDSLNGRGFRANHFVSISSEQGLLGMVYRPGIFRIDGTTNWKLECAPATRYQYSGLGEYRYDNQGIISMFPYWLAMTMTIALAAVPWMRWRFSLGTMLIATTLVAVMLGLTVFAAK